MWLISSGTAADSPPVPLVVLLLGLAVEVGRGLLAEQAVGRCRIPPTPSSGTVRSHQRLTPWRSMGQTLLRSLPSVSHGFHSSVKTQARCGGETAVSVLTKQCAVCRDPESP
jgi:hypothetical protein